MPTLDFIYFYILHERGHDGTVTLCKVWSTRQEPKQEHTSEGIITRRAYNSEAAMLDAFPQIKAKVEGKQ